MTISVVGRCARTRDVGVAITSSSPAVGARCAWVRPGVGAAATQNVTDPRLGPALLDRMGAESSADRAVHDLVACAPKATVGWRQLSAVDVEGRLGGFTGDRALGDCGQVFGVDVVVAGNLLAEPSVLTEAVAAFERHEQDVLPHRLLTALEAALKAGGEAGPVRSAGLLIGEAAEGRSWPTTDLRVDDDDAPVERLRALWQVWQPQAEHYVIRALDPDAAPGFGVPGDAR